MVGNNNNLLFFSRDYQAEIFARLEFKNFCAFHVTLTKKERRVVEKIGGEVVGCFEDYLEKNLRNVTVEDGLLKDYKLIGHYSSDRFLNRLDFTSRQKILFLEIKFWKDVLNEVKPYAVVNEPVALEVSDVLLTECNRLNVLYLALASFYIEDTFYFLPDPKKGTAFNLNDLKVSEKSKILASERLRQARVKMRPSYAVIRRNALALYLYSQTRIYFFEIFKSINCQNQLIRTACYTSTARIAWKNISNAIGMIFSGDSVYNRWNNDAEYMFYPLHFEPEAIVSYCAPKYSNQVALLERLLRSLPFNQVLLVKEHPQQPGRLCSYEFVALKKRWSNLVYVDYKEDPYDLISESIGVVTLGGTLGLEALVWGKPVMCLGSCYYEDFPGVYKPNSDERIENFNDFINKFSFCDELLVLNLAKVYSKLLCGNPFPNEYLLDKNNIINVTNSIELYLEGFMSKDLYAIE
jgi:hypothetical protein